MSWERFLKWMGKPDPTPPYVSPFANYYADCEQRSRLDAIRTARQQEMKNFHRSNNLEMG